MRLMVLQKAPTIVEWITILYNQHHCACLYEVMCYACVYFNLKKKSSFNIFINVGQPVFSRFDDNASIVPLAATVNDNVSIDTRIKFIDGGFCNMIKNIRTLTVRKDREQVYLCSNLITFSTQLCTSNERFGIEQQQTCIEPNVTLCKYDMKIVLLDFRESDIGMYNITVEFENDGNERGMLTQQFNITLSKGLPNGKNHQS